MISYGFDNTYWYSQQGNISAAASWEDINLAIRFMAVDLPRHSAADSITVWVLSSVDGTANTAESNTVVLANAATLTITTAFLIISANFL